MTDLFQDLLPVHQLLTDAGVPHWFAGGWAIDLFVGQVTRAHADIDVLVLDRDVERLRPLHDRGGLVVVHQHQPVPWPDDRPLEVGPEWLRLDPAVAGPVPVQIVLGLTDGDDWVYHRGNHSVRRPITEIGAATADGVPYLVPEVALRFESRLPTPKGEHGFAAAAPLLSAAQRQWLLGTLPADHRWRARLTA